MAILHSRGQSVDWLNSVSNDIARQWQRSNSTIDSATYEPAFNVVLHQPEIPPNTGAIGRTCVALHAKLWLVRPLGFRTDEKALRRAGLDYWKHLNWQVVDDWDDLLLHADKVNHAAGSQPYRMWMFTKKATRDFRDCQMQRGDWLVFGRETSGLPESLLGDPQRNLRIPTFDEVRSLNLASSVAVAGYQAATQIRLFSTD